MSISILYMRSFNLRQKTGNFRIFIQFVFSCITFSRFLISTAFANNLPIRSSCSDAADGSFHRYSKSVQHTRFAIGTPSIPFRIQPSPSYQNHRPYRVSLLVVTICAIFPYSTIVTFPDFLEGFVLFHLKPPHRHTAQRIIHPTRHRQGRNLYRFQRGVRMRTDQPCRTVTPDNDRHAMPVPAVLTGFPALCRRFSFFTHIHPLFQYPEPISLRVSYTHKSQ